MNPNKKGWLLKYFRDHLTKMDVTKVDEHDPEQEIYKKLQHTGLMYGHAIQLPQIDFEGHWNEHTRIKLVFMDSLFRSFVLFSGKVKDQSCITEKEFDLFCEDLSRFYQVIYPKVHQKKSLFYIGKETINDKVERVIESRVHLGNTWRQSFWTSFFHNSLLYLDVIYFALSYTRSEELSVLRESKEKTCITILKMIAAAASADGVIEKEEKELFNYFFHSAQISKKNQGDVKNLLNSPIDINDISFNEIDSWLLRKYLLEVSILTVWSDKDVNEAEKLFLLDLNKKMELSDMEMEQSFLAIQSFVLEYQDHVHYLKLDKNYRIISDRFISSLKKVVGQNKEKIALEIHESKELMFLLKKSKKERLTDEEKEKVRLQLLDILKTVPLFVIIALPGTFLTLPILLKILPPSAFPTAFQGVKND